MEDAGEITNLIDTKEGEFGSLYQRMDNDYKRWSMQSGQLPQTGDKSIDYSITQKKITGYYDTDVKIVSNDPRTSCDRVQATLSDADMQIMVRIAESEGEDKREEIGKLERLFLFAFLKGDERLRRLMMPPLREQLIWFALVRGWVAGRFLVYQDKKNVVFDFLPMDPRWLKYEMGANGPLWTGYTTLRSGASLKDEYGYVAKSETGNAVIDYWKYVSPGKIGNAVICDREFLKKPETYNLPSMPILILPVATRPPIAGTDGAGYGDSYFAAIRDIDDVRNQFASIVATWANLLAKQPTINYYDKDGKQLETTAYLAEAVLNLPMGHNKLEEAPMREVSPTVIQMLNWLNDQLERGLLPHIPLTQPPPSGTLYNLVQEAGAKVFNPQLKNLSNFYADICHLIEEQLISGKLKVKVQQEVRHKYYETEVTPVDLKKSHTIQVEFTARTPWTQLDTYQIADMAKRQGLPDSFIHEYILKLPDPKGIGDQVAIELAEHSPKLAMARAILALGKAGRRDEALQVVRDLYNMEMQEQTGREPSRPPEGEGSPLTSPVGEEPSPLTEEV